MKRNSGRHPLEIRSVEKSYDEAEVIPRFSANVVRGEKIALMGRNGAGKTTMLKFPLVRNAPGFIDAPDQQFPIDGGEVAGDTKWRSVTSRRITASPSPRDDGDRLALAIRSRRHAAELRA